MISFKQIIFSLTALLFIEPLFAGPHPYLSCDLKNHYGRSTYIYLYSDYRNPQIQVIGEQSFFLNWNRKYIEQGKFVNFVKMDVTQSYEFSFQLDPKTRVARFRDLRNKTIGYESLEANYFYNGTCQYLNVLNPYEIINELLTSQ